MFNRRSRGGELSCPTRPEPNRTEPSDKRVTRDRFPATYGLPQLGTVRRQRAAIHMVNLRLHYWRSRPHFDRDRKRTLQDATIVHRNGKVYFIKGG